MSDRPCDLTFHEGMFASYTAAGPLFSVGKLVCKQMAAQDLLTEKANQAISFFPPPTTVFEAAMTQKEADDFLSTLLQVNKHVASLVRQKGYGRIAHLALHAKSTRARNRNRRRAYNILRK